MLKSFTKIFSKFLIQESRSLNLLLSSLKSNLKYSQALNNFPFIKVKKSWEIASSCLSTKKNDQTQVGCVIIQNTSQSIWKSLNFSCYRKQKQEIRRIQRFIFSFKFWMILDNESRLVAVWINFWYLSSINEDFDRKKGRKEYTLIHFRE